MPTYSLYYMNTKQILKEKKENGSLPLWNEVHNGHANIGTLLLENGKC